MNYFRFLATFAFSFVFLINDAHAEERRFGSWAVGGSVNDTIYAKTINDSSSEFVFVCLKSERKCYAVLIIDSNCETGKKYLTLMNTDVGQASNHVLTCRKVENKNLYVFDGFKPFDRILNSSQVSFAFPLQSGKFKISRFLMNGSREAVNELNKGWKIMKNGNTETVDQNL